MKTIFTIGVSLLNLSVFAQEAGKAGELLKNEAKTSEMQTPTTEGLRGNNKPFQSNSGTLKPSTSPNRGNSGYRWNYNYGNAEVFLRIPQSGKYSVEIGDQLMSNSTGKFRFFDLSAGDVPISIYENNYLIYRTKLNVKNSTRLVLDFFPNYGLYLLGNYPVQNQSYGINEWDDVWNNPYGNQNGNNGNGNYYGNVMNNQDFTNFIAALKRNASFDKDKLAMAMSVSRNVNFTSQQIYQIAEAFSFDEGKLQVTKQLYAKCVDRQNFYMVYDAFSFDKSKKELSDYISRM